MYVDSWLSAGQIYEDRMALPKFYSSAWFFNIKILSESSKIVFCFLDYLLKMNIHVDDVYFIGWTSELRATRE